MPASTASHIRRQRPDTADFLAGGGEMGALARRLDWAATPLGPVSGWPQSLRTAASILLNSRHPMFLTWGPDLAIVYNDAYAQVLGERHPAALGRPFRDIWPEVWDDLTPMIATALSGQATWSEDMPFILTRHGYPEETWFTFSYSPIRDESGGVGGMFCACSETTAKVLLERRLNFQLRLSERQRGAHTAHDVVAIAAQMLGEALGLDRTSFSEVDAETGAVRPPEAWVHGALRYPVGRFRLSDFGPEVEADARAGRPTRIDDTDTDPRTGAEIYRRVGVRAFLGVSLIKQGVLVATLSAQMTRPRHWSDDEQALLSAVLEQTWSALQAARAEAALRESERRLRDVQAAGQIGSADWDLDSGWVHRSPEYLAIQGLPADSAPLIADPNDEWLMRVHPEDRDEVAAHFRDAAARAGDFEREYRIVRADTGEVRWVLNRGRVEADDTGHPIRLLSVQTDITARKREDLRRGLLVNELNHRVKNTLATVQSIAAQTLRNAASPEAAARDLENRLMALSRAHDVLTREVWEGARLSEIVAGAVGPYAPPGRCDVRGPDVWLSPPQALALAMALHELAVNAAKYGALVGAQGRVDIHWRRLPLRPGPGGLEAAGPAADATRTLRLVWTETGGPPVAAPTRRGFGARLLERGLGRDLGGEVHLDYQPEGVVCRIEAALAPDDRDRD
jgi:two-component sensor histidine kinase/PAS domain-containing protein